MADCDEVLHELYHFLDGELTDERRVRIAAPPRRLHDCLEVFDFEAELRQVIARKCHDRVPDALRNGMRSASRRGVQVEPTPAKPAPGTSRLPCRS